MSLLRHARHALWLRALRRCALSTVWTRCTVFGLSALAHLPPAAFAANHCLGQVHAATGKQQDAVDCYRRALASAPLRAATLHHHLGVALLALGRYGEAEASLLQAVAQKPSAWWSCNALGELMLRQGRLPEAERYFRQTLALNNAEPWAHCHLYEVEQVTAGHEAALEHWLDAVLAAPLMPELPLSVGLLWFERGNYTSAHVEKLRRVAERYPRSQEVRFFLGCLLSQQGQAEAAREYLAQYMAQAWTRDYNGLASPGLPRKDPEFLIIGTNKSGSSALYDYLVDHPLVCPAVVKEVNYWTTYFDHGHAWYRACFMPIPASAAQITGEGSIRTLWHEDAPRRVAAFRRDMKLLLLVREPVARAYSEYHMRRRMGEDLPDWGERIAQELEWLPQCPLEQDELSRLHGRDLRVGDVRVGDSLLLNGAVLPFLKRWLQHFPAQQFLVLRSEDLSRDVAATVNRAYQFLGVPPHQPSSVARRNVGSYPPMAPALELRLRQWYQPHQDALHKFLAAGMA